MTLLATCVERLAAPGGPWGRVRRHWLNSVERRLSTLANGSVSQKGGEPIVSLSLSLSSMKSERRPGPSSKGRNTRKREKPTPPTFSEAWLRTPEGWPAHPLSPPPSRNGRGGQPPLCKRPKYKAEKEGEAGRGWAWPPHHLRGGRLLIQRVGEMAIHLSQRERENSEVAGSPTRGVHHWSFVLESWGGGSNRSDVP